MTKKQLDKLKEIMQNYLTSGAQAKAKEDFIKAYATFQTFNNTVSERIISYKSKSSEDLTEEETRRSLFEGAADDEDDDGVGVGEFDNNVAKKIAAERKKQKGEWDILKESEKFDAKMYDDYFAQGEELYDFTTKEYAEKTYFEPLMKADNWLKKPYGKREQKIEAQLKNTLLMETKKTRNTNTFGFVFALITVLVGSSAYFGPYGAEGTCPESGMMVDYIPEEGFQSKLDEYAAPFILMLASLCFLWWRGLLPFLPKLTKSQTVMNASDIWTTVSMFIFNFVVNAMFGFLNLGGRFNRLARCMYSSGMYERQHTQRQNQYIEDSVAYERCVPVITDTWFGTGKYGCGSVPTQPEYSPPELINCMNTGVDPLKGSYEFLPGPEIESPGYGLTFYQITVGIFSTLSWATFGITNRVTDLICHAFDNLISSVGGASAFPLILLIISIMGANMLNNAYKAGKQIKDIEKEQNLDLIEASNVYRFRAEDVTKVLHSFQNPDHGPLGAIMTASEKVGNVNEKVTAYQHQRLMMALEEDKTMTLRGTLTVATMAEMRESGANENSIPIQQPLTRNRVSSNSSNCDDLDLC